MIGALLAVAAVALPPVGAGFDYQLGGDYPLPAGVSVVSRDWHDGHAAPGAYNVCYINAFQAQPGSEGASWRRRHPRLLLRRHGRYVVDRDWGETLFDTSTAGKRRALAAIIGRWIDGCARKGFQAVEPDNLDSWTRSRGLLTRADNLAFARRLIARAHARGLAIAQKNTPELGARGRAIGFDFAIAEECQAYHECGRYTRAYGNRVYEIEYADNGGRAAFDAACAARGDRISVTYRDRNVVPRGDRGFVADFC